MASDVVTQLASVNARIVEEVDESAFYIPMTGPAARPRRSLKHDDTFIVLDSHGDIGASAGGPDGLFNSDGTPKADLFLKDGVHLNDDGYKIWQAHIAKALSATTATPAISTR